MGLITVDQEKCQKDGLCVGECPAAIIKLTEGDGFPDMVPGGQDLCILCGHCVAVCPHGALTHKHIPLEACPPIDHKLIMTETQAVQFLRSRRSIRRYRDKPVEKEKIRKLIEIARYAPTGSNSQLVEWRVLTDKTKIKPMAGLTIDWMRQILKEGAPSTMASYFPLIVAAWDAGYDAVLRGAPALIVASAPAEAGNGMVDLTLALSYLELAAPTLGLGTCWAGLLQRAVFSSPSLKEALGIPLPHPYHYPMMIGYPQVKYQRLPERKPPKIIFE
jgi:nitroreductase/NAD-dependent dihydropyrimidine dehydrogenase PreA subunit